MNPLALIPYGKFIAVGLALAAVIAYGEWRGHTRYNQAVALWSAKYNERETGLIIEASRELNRQRAANEAAKKVEAERIAMIRAENQALEERIKELEHEADNDPDADRIGVSDGSRMRIDSVK